MNDLKDGVLSYLEALRIISRYQLWNYLIIPMSISLLLGAIILAGAWGLSDNIGAYLVRLYPWEWEKEIIATLASVAGGILVIFLGLLLYKNLVIILAAPFMSALSEKVESIVLQKEVSIPFSVRRMMADLMRGLRISLRNLVRELFFTLLLFLLSLIPIFSPFAAAIIIIVQAYYAGAGNLDFYLERHLKVRESVQFVKRNKWLSIGNGIVYISMLFLLVGFLIAPVLGTIAATIEGTKRLEQSDT